jgi:hypothetical protein
MGRRIRSAGTLRSSSHKGHGSAVSKKGEVEGREERLATTLVNYSGILGFWMPCKCLILLAPQVGLEPKTLRLRATEFASSPADNICYKPLYYIRLHTAKKFLIAVNTA